MKHRPYCLIQNDKTRQTFFWLGESLTEGKWIEGTPQEFEGFKEFNDVIFNSVDPVEALCLIAQEWNNEKDC